MTAQEIIKSGKNLKISETRNLEDEYSEVVLMNNELEEWNKVLVAQMGQPLKPTGSKPTKEDLNLTKDFGGIRNDQTLYKRDSEKGFLLAMLWPWQNNTHTTLKIILINK